MYGGILCVCLLSVLKKKKTFFRTIGFFNVFVSKYNSHNLILGTHTTVKENNIIMYGFMHKSGVNTGENVLIKTLFSPYGLSALCTEMRAKYRLWEKGFDVIREKNK